MMEFNIEKGFLDSLDEALLEIAALNNVPVEKPNADLTTYPDLWLKLSVVRGQTVPVTLGLQGTDNHNGFCQIDINVPSGTGSGDILKIASSLKLFYPAGKSVGLVVVASSSVSSARFVGSWYRVSVTINYYSRIARIA